MKFTDILLALLLPGLVLLHLALAPYTKVEESFNVQAAHDILAFGTPVGRGATARLAARFDHAAFSGAVPRTFVGAILLAGVTQPLLAAADSCLAVLARAPLSGPAAQLAVRAVLGLANAAALLGLARALAAAAGRPAARWYVVLQASQFHVLFYASRTLPNAFALFLTTLAFAFLVGASAGRTPGQSAGRIRVALCLLVFAAVVFRAEVALLLAGVAGVLVVRPLASVQQVVRVVAVAATVALVLSVPIDTYMWHPVPAFVHAVSLPGALPAATLPLWPELYAFVFNVVGGHASAWGTSPWHYYLTSALPRLLLNPLVPLVLVPTALRRPATRAAAALLVVPALLFVAVYSLQPHKEARFVLYVVPPLTAAAALGADQLTRGFTRRAGDETQTARQTGRAAAALVLLASTALALAASTAMLLVSALNYPGGEALAALRQRVLSAGSAGTGRAPGVVTVHADVLACMTGVTRFMAQLGPVAPRADDPSSASRPRLAVDKTEDPLRLRDPDFWAQFDYLLVEDPSAVPQSSQSSQSPSSSSSSPASAWDTVAVVQGVAGIERLRPGSPDDGLTETQNVVGHGAIVARLRQAVRARTGGWWVGPRMAPRIYVLQQVRPALKADASLAATAIHGSVDHSGRSAAQHYAVPI